MLDDGNGPSSTAQDSAGAGDFEAQEEAPGAGSGLPEMDEPPGNQNPRRVDPDVLRSAALALASGDNFDSLLRGRHCADIADDVSDDLLVSQYRGVSGPALLIVDEDQATYRLVDCDTGWLITKGTL
jgi:hypothetical protein